MCVYERACACVHRPPNGKGLAHWPKYEAGEEYLEIAAKEQAADWFLKKEHYVFMTQTLTEKVRQYREKRAVQLSPLHWFLFYL